METVFRRASLESIGGRQVWSWSISPTEGSSEPRRFYAAQIGDSYLLLTNNRDDFLEMVNILTSETFRQIPIGISGWDTFSTYGYWMYRSLRKGVGIDPGTASMTDLTPDVTALFFCADVGTRKGLIRVFSADESMKTVPKIRPAPQLGRLKPQGTGIWQATIPLSKDEAASEALFHVFNDLGFGGNI